MLAWLDERQVGAYLGAIALGLVVAHLPGADGLSVLVTPILVALLFATFLTLPLTTLRIDVRFTALVLGVNFLVVPLLVAALTLPVRGDLRFFVPVLIVLLSPCVDYVVSFTGLAGGARNKLLGLTPIMLLGQMLLLPGYLRICLGEDAPQVVAPGPFLNALVWMLLIPVVGAFIVQVLAGRSAPAQRVARLADEIMVPLMMLTLFVVVAAYAGQVTQHLSELALTLGIYVLFAVVMNLVGVVASKLAGFTYRDGVAVTFAVTTRNSLIVLPFILALGEGYEIAPVVVVAQTLIELCVMVVMVKMYPDLHKRTRLWA